MALTLEQKQQIVKLSAKYFDTQHTEEEALTAIRGVFWLDGDYVAHDDYLAVSAGVKSCYESMRASRVKKPLQSRETLAVALYDALVALGWTPPA